MEKSEQQSDYLLAHKTVKQFYRPSKIKFILTCNDGLICQHFNLLLFSLLFNDTEHRASTKQVNKS